MAQIASKLKAVPKLKTQTPSSVYPGLRWMGVAVLLVAIIGMFLVSLAIGSVNIPLNEVVTILLGRMPERTTWTKIVLDLRLPQAITAMFAGAALGVGGLQMQTLFRNPLADPFALGISSGASLGVALVVLSAGVAGGGTLLASGSALGNMSLVVAASGGAGVTLLLVLIAARRVQNMMTLLILGLMFGYFTSAGVSLLMHFSLAERLRAFISWSYGSFGGMTWTQLPIFALVVCMGLALAYWLRKALNALLLGEEYAWSMGLNVGRARLGIILSTALLAGAVTAFCGPIGFIGIAVPHVCRSLFQTADHRVLMPMSLLMGGLIALIASFIANVPGSDIILPLNAVTALMGAPIVIGILLRRESLAR